MQRGYKNSEKSLSSAKNSQTITPFTKENQDLNSIHLNLLLNDKKHRELMRQNKERQKRKNELILRDLQKNEEKRNTDLQNFKNEKKQAYYKFMKGVDLPVIVQNESKGSKTEGAFRSKTIGVNLTINKEQKTAETSKTLLPFFSAAVGAKTTFLKSGFNSTSESYKNETNDKLNFERQNCLISEKMNSKANLILSKEEIKFEKNIEEELERILFNESQVELFCKSGPKNLVKILDKKLEARKPIRAISPTKNESQLNDSIFREFMETEAQVYRNFPDKNQEISVSKAQKNLNFDQKNSSNCRIKNLVSEFKETPVKKEQKISKNEMVELNSLNNIEEKLKNSILRLENDYLSNQKRFPSSQNFSQGPFLQNKLKLRTEKQVMMSIENLNSRILINQFSEKEQSNLHKNASKNNFEEDHQVFQKISTDNFYNKQISENNYDFKSKEILNPVWNMPDTISLVTATESVNNERGTGNFQRKGRGQTYVEKKMIKVEAKSRNEVTMPKKGEFVSAGDGVNQISYKPELVKGLFQ